jgi:hypothetical protein
LVSSISSTPAIAAGTTRSWPAFAAWLHGRRSGADERDRVARLPARVLGWADESTQPIEHALRSIQLSVSYRAALVLLGDGDLVPIARALHRRTLGDGRPFVVYDPRQRHHGSGAAAFEAARGGSLCVRRRRMPRDFQSVVALARDPAAAVQLVVCADAHHAMDPFLSLPAPIRIPPLRARASELERIIDEYADDAIRDLSADETGFTSVDRDWVIGHSASTLPEIETGTCRLVAIRQTGSIDRAAERLGMSNVALAEWFGRRRLDRRGKVQP